MIELFLWLLSSCYSCATPSPWELIETHGVSSEALWSITEAQTMGHHYPHNYFYFGG